MEVLHQRCAGMDISKRDAKVCVRIPGARPGTYRKQVSVHGAMRCDIAVLGDHLVAEQVTLVVMEATGDYWKPFYYGMEDRLNLMLVNARHAKNLPGRKTDISDAQWLTELAAHGLVRGSFIPPWPIRAGRRRTLHARRDLAHPHQPPALPKTPHPRRITGSSPAPTALTPPGTSPRPLTSAYSCQATGIPTGVPNCDEQVA